MSMAALQRIFAVLTEHYGPQNWWPGDSPFEIMVGAILTQNTAWSNVEKAIDALKQAGALCPDQLLHLPEQDVAGLIRSSGYFNVKARRLRNFCAWYQANGAYEQLNNWSTHELREGLLQINGVGPETADDILLYAFDRPVFVIDAYTRRLFSRLGLLGHDLTYETLRREFENSLESDHQLFNEFHALIVIHAKDICKPRPACEQCCLITRCPHGKKTDDR